MNIVHATRNTSPERGNEPTTYSLNVIDAVPAPAPEPDPFTENRQRGVPKIGKPSTKIGNTRNSSTRYSYRFRSSC